ncbi:MAG TPA: SRPBCC family protein [Candidatus Limnocylindrales bacterium]|nr:SRPBCC family protein [Candidatus Limnocylindrales bacterium]
MIEIREVVTVDRAASDVFAHLARIEALPAWLPPIRTAEQLDPGPLRIGTRARLTIDGPGRTIRATAEITELEPATAIAFRTLDAPAGVRARCQLVPLAATRTELRLTASIELPGLLRFAEGVARDRIRREMPIALEELRRRLEASVASGGSPSTGDAPTSG